MLRILRAIVGVAALSAVISAGARADTIDTFTFTEGKAITLQSSFTPLMPIPAAAPAATAPEPASAFLLLIGAALVFIGRFRRGQTPRRGQPCAAALLPLAVDWPNTTTRATQNHHSTAAHSGLEPSF